MHLYVSRSDDGGATWLASQRASDTPTAWTSVLTNLAPNQGDYIHITSDEGFVRPVWADGRSGNPDVYATAIDTRFEFTNCGPDTTVTAGTTTIVQFPFTAANSNPLFGNDYTYCVASTRNWPLGDGPDFRGVYDLEANSMLFYERQARGRRTAPVMVN